VNELPPDWRDAFVDMVRGARPLDGTWFAGGPGLSPLAQIGIYRQQFRMRLGDAFREEILGLRHMLGDGLQDVTERYLADCPPRSWTLDRVADRLVEWLVANQAPDEHVDMARLDRAVMWGFSAEEGENPRPEALVPENLHRLRLQPHVTLLRLGFGVHRYRTAVLSGIDPAPLAPGTFRLAVFRVDRKMRHLELERGAAALLEGLAAEGGLDGAIDAALSEVGQDALAAGLTRWFQLFVERGLVRLL
jgi:hypothetical protein